MSIDCGTFFYSMMVVRCEGAPGQLVSKDVATLHWSPAVNPGTAIYVCKYKVDSAGLELGMQDPGARDRMASMCKEKGRQQRKRREPMKKRERSLTKTQGVDETRRDSL